ncbi:MAG TPA: hypothetical protein VGW39_01950 [Chthoniobacterales bacterium]|nr:hypothetical protein [Chthoniobacterales bacterium]
MAVRDAARHFDNEAVVPVASVISRSPERLDLIDCRTVSLEQLESAILGLTLDERQRLAVWFEENRRELLGDDPDELSEEQKGELVRRRELALAHPELLEPWDGTIERVRERLHEFRSQKTSTR